MYIKTLQVISGQRGFPKFNLATQIIAWLKFSVVNPRWPLSQTLMIPRSKIFNIPTWDVYCESQCWSDFFSDTIKSTLTNYTL